MFKFAHIPDIKNLSRHTEIKNPGHRDSDTETETERAPQHTQGMFLLERALGHDDRLQLTLGCPSLPQQPTSYMPEIAQKRQQNKPTSQTEILGTTINRAFHIDNPGARHQKTHTHTKNKRNEM
jgi:hypothetical protein